jgi:ribonuclease-3 family protein
MIVMKTREKNFKFYIYYINGILYNVLIQFIKYFYLKKVVWMISDFFNKMTGEFNYKPDEVRQLSPLVLAYIGDAVYEVFIRTMLVTEGNVPVHVLHKRSIAYVKAKAQSDVIHRIMPFLTEEELGVVRRGRNAKSATVPKNADVSEYRYATGFESLIGFLYLKKDYERLMDILRMAIVKD